MFSQNFLITQVMNTDKKIVKDGLVEKGSVVEQNHP